MAYLSKRRSSAFYEHVIQTRGTGKKITLKQERGRGGENEGVLAFISG